MSIKWSGLGPELLLALDRKATEPLRVQLEGGLREAIRSRRLAPDERLPSTRQLARDLGLSRGLVQECYAQLLAEGYLTARPGSGTRVAAAAREASAVLPTRPAVEQRLTFDFAAGKPDLSSFPHQDWMWAMREVSRTVPADLMGYGDPRGNRRLREVLAGYLRRVRAVDADPERIIVCTGFQQGSNLVLRALARRGVERVALEDPGDMEFSSSEQRWGLQAVPVAVDEQGIDTAALERSGARAAVLTPAHQSPTGGVLGPDRRRALAHWAGAQEATIIEDDYDAEFRYDREPVGALQGLAPDRVALIGTVSKSLAPALRMGWILCPAGLVDQVAADKEDEDRGSPGLEQLALATLIESGRYDKHLRRMRTVYAGKRRALIDALGRHAPEVRLRGLAAGFHAVAQLPPGVEEQTLVAAARERSIGLYPMSDYRADQSNQPPELVIGFGNLSEPSIERGIATVADLLRPT